MADYVFMFGFGGLNVGFQFCYGIMITEDVVE